ncbi:MAG: metal-dependent hydrolase [Candidatus Thiodiazotropha sp.]
MLAPTHIVIGQFGYLATCLATGHPPGMAEAWVAAGCALLPDLDKRNSIVGRLFPYISEPIEYRFGHRTLTHSLLFAMLVALVMWPLLPFGWWLAVVSGYASHPVADMMTLQGVEWFWPSRWRCVLPGNERYRMKAMGWGELGFALILGLLSIPMLLVAQSGEGTGGIIKAAIGSIEEARERYDAEKGANAWTLRVEGRDNRSYEDIGGEYPVIGPWREGGFIVEGEAGPRSVCRSSTCDWYAESGVAVKGDSEAVTVRHITAKSVGRQELLRVLKPLREAGRVYLLGSLEAGGIEQALPSVEVSGEVVSLTYADVSVLEGWRREWLRKVELVIQVRHAEEVSVQDIGDIAHYDANLELINGWIE